MHGFTLLEVLVVVTLLGILLAVAVPALKPFWQTAVEKEAARNVLAALRIARSQAVGSNLEYQVAFDLDSCSYWLEQGNLSSDSTDWSRVQEFGRFPDGVKMATGVECINKVGDGDISHAENKIQFNPNGTCGSSGPASSAYICIMDAADQRRFRSGFQSTRTARAVIARWDAGSACWQ